MDDERPLKRQRLDCPSPSPPLLAPIPQHALLLALPSLLAHPPTHRNHTHTLVLSQLALRRYLALPQLDSIDEFRALVELVEVGFRTGLKEPGVENEVERAISRALVIVAKHPSLRIHKTHLTILSARLASHQGNQRSEVSTLKRLVTTAAGSGDPPHVVYAAHIAYITALAAHTESVDDSVSDSKRGVLVSLRANGNTKALIAIRDFRTLAARNGHTEVESLALVMELRELVCNGVWTRVGKVLKEVEGSLGVFDGEEKQKADPSSSIPMPASDPVSARSNSSPSKPKPTPTKTELCPSPLTHILRVHVALLGALFHTHVGAHGAAQACVHRMHALLDSGEAAEGALSKHGIVEVRPGGGNETPLRLQATHPRTLFGLGFLVSAVAKRDPTGRKPKRRQFASEGVKVVDNELKKEVCVPMWASTADVSAFRERMNRIRADMICELVAVAVQRSEFDEAELHLSHLIAHTRTHGLFPAYAARVTLHQAHLAHALGQSERALKCYEVAAWLARPRGGSENQNRDDDGGNGRGDQRNSVEDMDGQEDCWLNVSARAGSLWLRLGLAASSTSGGTEGYARAMAPLREEGKALVQECAGMGGALEAVGAVLGACLGEECLDVKTNLRTALSLSTTAEDNHLRPLVLALCADQYFHTAPDHAGVMLQVADGLAAGLGAQPKVKAKEGEAMATDKVGNAHLRMWIGERALELKRRKGDEEAAAAQAQANEALRRAVVRVEKRGARAPQAETETGLVRWQQIG